MRIQAIILVILMLKAGVTTGFCTPECHDHGSTKDAVCLSIESGDRHQNSSIPCEKGNDDAQNDQCLCNCCHIASYIDMSDRSELFEEPSSHIEMPHPVYHSISLTDSVFRPPC